MKKISVSSSEQTEMIDITSKVRGAIRESGVQTGTATICAMHTTAAVTINENADPDVMHDMLTELNKIVPFDDHYRHAEGNSAAHIKSSLVGASETVIIEDGEPLLGTWQGIFFCDFDGPRSRRVLVQVIGR